MLQVAFFCFTEGMQNVVLAFVDDIYEDLELWYPKLRLEEAGYRVVCAGLGDAKYRGKHGYPCVADGHVRGKIVVTLR